MLTTHPLLVPRLRKSWGIPSLTLWVLLGLLWGSLLIHITAALPFCIQWMWDWLDPRFCRREKSLATGRNITLDHPAHSLVIIPTTVFRVLAIVSTDTLMYVLSTIDRISFTLCCLMWILTRQMCCQKPELQNPSLRTSTGNYLHTVL
jgi:sterol desaturase/sphingolipid hydroxylase (fatty acid hydroxylase superfamily)